MRKTILSGAAIALLAAAPTASAADRTGTISATSPAYAWDGGPGTSVGANVPNLGGASVGNFVGCFDGIADCEDTLLKVEAPGKLTVIADAADDSKDVLDMYLYETNEAGEFDNQATDLVEGAGASEKGDERIDYQVKPGYYMIHIKFFLADADTYKGTAELSGFPPPPVAVTPVASEPPPPPAAPQSQSQSQPQPAAPPAQPHNADQPAAKKKSRKAACKKKAKKLKGSKRARALKKCARLKG